MTIGAAGSSTAGDTGSRRRNVEAILPLLPNQRALLLFAEREHDDPGFLQVRATLKGPLDRPRMERAWAEVVTWHQALRTSLHAAPEGDPRIVVWRSVAVEPSYEDLTDLGAAEQDAHLERLLAGDRRAGLNLNEPPAMRVSILSRSPSHHEIVWTCHHLFIDGWSAAIVLEDLMTAYHGFGTDPAPAVHRPPSDGLRTFSAWVADRDEGPEENYWRERLAGFQSPPPLSLGDPAQHTPGFDELTVPIDPAIADRVLAAGAALRVTVNTLVQAAWGLVVGRLLDTDDVVFGTTVAGRSAPIEGMERLVGYFSNAVPIRVTVDDDRPVGEWLTGVRDDQFALQAFEHSSLADIQAWGSIPGHRQLFETFLVVENFPAEPESRGHPDELSLSGFRSGLTTAFPLTVAFALGDPWFVHFRFDTGRNSAEAARLLAEELIATLEAIVDGIDLRLKDVRPGQHDRLASLVSDSLDRPPVTGARYREPERPTEMRLAAIWQELLDLPRVGIDDDYFALGGTSLGAVRMLSRIEEELGAVLPLRTLLRHATIAGLAGVIDGEETAPATALESLVPIQPDGTRIPLVAIHGGDGEVLKFRALSRALGPEQPFYGVEAVGLDGQTKPLDTVEEMAARYIGELRSIQPVGPYRLIGYCFGGSVGLEMAHQLEAAGETVDLLAVIDGGLPLEAARTSSILARAGAVFRTRGLRGTLKAIVARLRDRTRVAWDGSVSSTARRKRAYLRVAAGCRDAFGSFQAKYSEAPILLVRSERDHAGFGKDWHIGWDAYTPSLTTVSIDADHELLLEDSVVDQVADAIRASLPVSD